MNQSEKLDCVEMKNRIQKTMFDELEKLDRDQQLAYVRQQAENGPLAEWVEKVRAAAREKAS